MAEVNTYLHALNVGVVDKKHLTRVDLERMRLSAEIQTNIQPVTTGPASGRPGLEYLGGTLLNASGVLRPFIAGSDSAALLELTPNAMRVWVNDARVERPAVTCTVPNGDFSTTGSWTDVSTTGATATISAGSLRLTAPAKGSLACAKQQVSTSSAGVEHALRIIVDRGPVTFRLGSSDGGDDLITETSLPSGSHSLGFTPPGASFWIQFQSGARVLRNVSDCNIEPAGPMNLATPWPDPTAIRFAQSADVMFCAYRGVQQHRIERRSDRSWSVGKYQSDDGPFSSGRTAPVRLVCSVYEGNGALTSDRPFFEPGHVGALFRLYHTGQHYNQRLAGDREFTDPIKVTGINSAIKNDRLFYLTVAGTWAGTLRTYRSFDGPEIGYSEYRRDSSGATIPITANAGFSNFDTDDNAIVYYRVGFEDGDYTSGTAEIDFFYDGGGDHGIVRVVEYQSSTQVQIEVLRPVMSTFYTSDWQESEWSGVAGYPSGVAFFEGRLWWGGRDRFWGSVSDSYESFDDTVEGDSGPIARSIATGGVNQVQWVAPFQRLIMGTDGTETSARSSSFDEPITPTNVVLKNFSTIGSAPVDPARVDQRGLFVDRSRAAIFEMVFDGTANDYVTTQLTRLASDLFGVGIKELTVQRRPDTRIWCVLDTGDVGVILYEPSQEVVAFTLMRTEGEVISMTSLPDVGQDRIYALVKRGRFGEFYYVEKMALDSEVKPSTLCKVMDSFKVASPSGTAVTGADHLAGQEVVVWADGAPVTEVVDGYTVPKTFTVDSFGNFTLSTAATSIVYGLPYIARYKSARLAYGAQGGTAVLQKKKIGSLGILWTDFTRAGMRYGPAFDDPLHPLFPLPINKDGMAAPDIVLSDVDDEEQFSFPGEWSTDSRFCFEWQSPFTATILGLVIGVETNG